MIARSLVDGVDVYFTGARLDGVADANLAHHVPHVPELLAGARRRVAELTSTDLDTWHFMRQAHGACVGVVDDRVPPGAEIRDVDVLVTTLVDRPLLVLAADCLPVIAAGRQAVGVAHAGWRGVVAGVADALVDAMCAAGERVEDVSVAIGPAIGPCCYEVGDEVHSAVTARQPGAAAQTRSGRDAVDLRAAFEAQLLTRGIVDVTRVPEPDVEGTVCTACDARWFSHRRDPRSGRQAGVVVRRGGATQVARSA